MHATGHAHAVVGGAVRDERDARQGSGIATRSHQVLLQTGEGDDAAGTQLTGVDQLAVVLLLTRLMGRSRVGRERGREEYTRGIKCSVSMTKRKTAWGELEGNDTNGVRCGDRFFCNIIRPLLL